jgi:hypothetical protein
MDHGAIELYLLIVTAVGTIILPSLWWLGNTIAGLGNRITSLEARYCGLDGIDHRITTIEARCGMLHRRETDQKEYLP